MKRGREGGAKRKTGLYIGKAKDWVLAVLLVDRRDTLPEYGRVPE